MTVSGKWRRLAVPAVLVALALWVLPSQAAVPAGGRLDFTVMRNGEEVGRHELVFRKYGDKLDIDIATRVAVKVLFVTAYRFEHDGHETWQNGELVRLTSVTNDDGTHHTLDVRANGHGLDVVGDGSKSNADAAIIPASLWNEGILAGGKILNTLDGRKMAIDVREIGKETVEVRGEPVSARHFAVTGELERELWFDSNDVLVKVRFKGKDGSDIDYLLR